MISPKTSNKLIELIRKYPIEYKEPRLIFHEKVYSTLVKASKELYGYKGKSLRTKQKYVKRMIVEAIERGIKERDSGSN